MRIKICGLFREQDIDYVNEALSDYAGFVFAESRRQVSPAFAEKLRSRLKDNITPVGVFVNAPIAEITALYKNGIISIAQLHGEEDEEYITQLKEKCAIPIIKTIKITAEDAEKTKEDFDKNSASFASSAVHNNSKVDYLLLDSGAGSGKPFDWDLLKTFKTEKPWFLAGGINLDNIWQAIALNPFAIDVSSGTETDGYKNREKILQLVTTVRKGSIK
jgi:phosphoribosylanthranilate isomerase